MLAGFKPVMRVMKVGLFCKTGFGQLNRRLRNNPKISLKVIVNELREKKNRESLS